MLPETPADLTPAWLTGALGQFGEVERVRVQRVGQDYGFTGVIVRLELDYAAADSSAPVSVVAKLPMARDDAVSGYRRMQEVDPVRRDRYYERSRNEARFYRDFGAACAPELFYAAADEERRRVVILLEDVGGGRQGDVLGGCTVDEAALVLDELALVHARWWGKRAPSAVFPDWAGDPAARQERYAAAADSFLERHGRRLPPVVASVAGRLRSRLGEMVAALDAGPRALIHADVHLDNVIFSARGVTLLDWQTVSIGPPAWDLAMFLVGSLRVEDRRAGERGLLDRYLEKLSVAGYSRDALLLDYRRALVALLAGTVHWAAHLDEVESTSRERALRDDALAPDGRLVQALVDHDAATLVA